MLTSISSMRELTKGAPVSSPRTFNVALLYLITLFLQLVWADVEVDPSGGVSPGADTTICGEVERACSWPVVASGLCSGSTGFGVDGGYLLPTDGSALGREVDGGRSPGFNG